MNSMLSLPSLHSSGRNLLVLLLSLLLASCSFSEELYSGLNEQEANDIVSILQSHNLSGEKIDIGKGKFAVEVIVEQFPQAVQILRLWGLPREKTASLGDLFKPSGLVPTPMEEKVRFVYGLTEELSNTLSEIEGVVNVRLHISLSSILKKQTSFNDRSTNSASKASVFIQYEPSRITPDTLVLRVKRLVADSVPRLKTDNVVVLVQEQESFTAGAGNNEKQVVYLGNVIFQEKDLSVLIFIFGGLATLTLCITGAIIILRRRNNQIEQ